MDKEVYDFRSRFNWIKIILGSILVPVLIFWFYFFGYIAWDTFQSAHYSLEQMIIYIFVLCLFFIPLLILIYSIIFSLANHLIIFKADQEGISVKNIFSLKKQLIHWEQFKGYTLTEVRGKYASYNLLILYRKNNEKIVLDENWYKGFKRFILIIKENIPKNLGEEKDVILITLGLKPIPNHDE